MNKKILKICSVSLFLGIITTMLHSASIKLRVVDGSKSPPEPLNDVVVIVVGFTDIDGEPRAEFSTAYKIDFGTKTHFIDGLKHKDPKTNNTITYKIGIVKQKYSPTIKEQINNPQIIPKVVFENFHSTVSFTGVETDPNPRPPLVMYPAPSGFQAGILNIKIPAEGVPDNTLFTMDLRHKITDEQVTFGAQLKQGQDPDGKFSLQIYNVPPAPANTYRLCVTRPDTMEGAEVIVSTAVYDNQHTFQDITLGFISTTRSEVPTTVDVSNIAFEGLVLDRSSNPIANCTVELRDTDNNFAPPPIGRRWSEFNYFRTLTDASGRFVIYTPVRISSYSVQISKLGYKSKFDSPMLADGYGHPYKGTRVILPKYFLDEATGTIKGRVRLKVGEGENVSYRDLPDAWVTLHTEWDNFKGPYPVQPGHGAWFNTITDGAGFFEFKGVAPGQYNLQVNHNILSKGPTIYWKGWEWGNYNPNPNEPWNWRYTYNYGPNQVSSRTAEWPYTRLDDDRRIVVTSDTIKTFVYDAEGDILYDHSGDPIIEIDLEIPIFTTATINGMFYFPLDAEVNVGKIKVIAYPIDPNTRQRLDQYSQWMAYYPRQMIHNQNQSRNDIHVTIEVSTGTYYVEIKSDEWAPARSYNTIVRLDKPGGFWQLPNIHMVRAGRVEGKIKLPDGSYFQAKDVPGKFWTAAEIEISGIDVEFNTRYELRSWSPDNTKFVFEGLPPGKYNLRIYIKKWEHPDSNAKEVYPTAIIPNVRVSARQTTFVEATVKDGIMCEPVAPIPPDKPEVVYRDPQGVGVYGLIGFPSDVSLSGPMLQALTLQRGILDDFQVQLFGFDPRTKQWETKKLLPGKYNFYMVFLRFFGPKQQYNPEQGGMPNNNPDEYMTVISRAENVNVKSDDLVPGATFQIKMGAGVMGSGIITGRVRGKNMFLPEDGEKIKGYDKEVLNIIPTVMLYDMEGKWRGYSAARPDREDLNKWMLAIMAGDVDRLNKMINSDDKAVMSPVYYYIDNLPIGKYVLVCETKNYPPVTKIVTISTGTTTVNIDFDEEAMAGARISGIVTDETNNPISEANVVLTHRLTKKKVVTDSNGKFEATGIPAGVWKIDVAKSGYASGGEKISLGKDNRVVTIKLKKATAKISGKIYVRESAWSRKNVYSGAKVVCYNETENVTNPGKYLPSITVKTENDGSYLIPDLILGNTYYVYAFVPERPVYYRRVYVSSNTMSGIDFDIMPSTPTLKITMKRTENPYIFRFIIESPRPLVSVPVCYYSPGRTYDENRKVRALPTKGVKNSYILDVEIPQDSDEENYTLQIKGQYGMNEYMTETLTFSQKALIKAKKEVADELAEGGAILIDEERADNSEIELTPGTLTPDEMVDIPIGGFLSALPNLKFSKTGKEIARMVETTMKDIVASDVYEISLEKAQVNKTFDVALNYDRTKVTEKDLKDLKIYRYNDTTDRWERVDGAITIDPLTATVSVETDTLETKTPARPAPKTVVRNGVFALNRSAPTSQKGIFAIFKQDPNTAKDYTGNEFVIYNFPNPFDLNTKNVVLQDVTSSANQTIKGTMIKYALPSGKGGRIKLYIYNLAGELVRTIDEGEKTGGKYWYTEWDGKNDSSEECASGVYFLIVKKDGERLNNKPLKMVIMK